MSGQGWTPAPKRGAIPLHPMTFGMLLGRSFAALRHNPKVLFGFAVVVQLAALLITGLLIGAAFTIAFMRLATVRPGSEEFTTIQAGTVGLAIVFGIGAALMTAAMTAIMQGVVAADISLAAIGRKGTLRALWKRMAPAFWRLTLYAVLQAVALVLGFGIVALAIFATAAGSGLAGAAAAGLTIGLVVVIGFGSIPLLVWLGTKLLLVPSVLVLEHAPLRVALMRSWRLIRGRFWIAFGVMILISLIMGLAANVVSIPGALVTSIITGIVAPTGEPTTGQIVTLVFAIVLPQILVLAVQAIAQVVQCTGATLVYVDSRMRYEGLDQTLIAHSERSAIGWTDEQLGDPFAVDPARAVTGEKPQLPVSAPVHPAPPTYTPPGYAPHPGWAPQPGATGDRRQQFTTPTYPPSAAPVYPPPAPPVVPAPAQPSTPPAPPAPPSDSPWAPPSSGA